MSLVNSSLSPIGFEGEILKILSKALNFSYSFINCSNWGLLDTNNTWTGVVAQLVNEVCQGRLVYFLIIIFVPWSDCRYCIIWIVDYLWQKKIHRLFTSISSQLSHIHNIGTEVNEKHYIYLWSLWAFDLGFDSSLNFINIFHSFNVWQKSREQAFKSDQVNS